MLKRRPMATVTCLARLIAERLNIACSQPLRKHSRSLAYEPLEPRLPLAFVPSLLADINTTPAGFSVNGSNFAELGGQAYFFDSVSGQTTSLWRTDGTTGGTISVADVSGTDLIRAGDRLYFFAHADELWSSDGTAGGTRLVTEMQPGEGRGFPRDPAVIGNRLYFIADDGTHGRELWRTDGTPEGTQMVRDIAPGAAASTPEALTDVNGNLFFTATDGTFGRELWKSDGTEQGTVLVKNIRPGSASSMASATSTPIVNFNGQAFFIANDGSVGPELWKSDGTEPGTVRVKDVRTGPQTSDIRKLTAVGNVLYFAAEDQPGIRKLWKTNGTEAGTEIVSEIGSGHISHIAALPDGRIIFSASTNAASQYQIWVSDGSSSGTHLLNNNVRDPQRFTALGSVIYFESHGDDFYSTGLWQSDGTESGTRLVKSVIANSSPFAAPSLFPLAAAAGKIYFATSDEINQGYGSQLWVSDGTFAGTRLVPNGREQTLSSLRYPVVSLTLGLATIFVAHSDTLGQELWRTDGTPEGTFTLRDIRTGPHGSSPDNLIAVNGRAYFTAADENQIRRLWTTDGTVAGTLPIALEAVTTSILALKNINGALVFTTRKEIWKTDGTSAGTILLKTFDSFFQIEGPSGITQVGAEFFFRANASSAGFELWKSNGTPDGTTLVKLVADAVNIQRSNLVNYQGALFFAADDGTHGKELWKSDGTEAGTVMVQDLLPGPAGSDPWFFTVVRDKLVFRSFTSTTSPLWVTDGTAENTFPLADFSRSNRPYWQAMLNDDTLVFSATSPSSGEELWKTDGTVEGTVLLRDIRAGSDGSYPSSPVNVNGVVLFNASTSDGTAATLWVTDGTEAGTRPYFEAPSNLTASGFLSPLGDHFVYMAYDEAHGYEPWSARFVNVAPAFQKGPNIDVTDEDGSFGNNAWATAIVAGPADESPQSVEFVVETSNPDVFLDLPKIDATGSLTFTPRPNASGSAAITVRVRDSGGTLFGGTNTSAPETFVINVTKPHPLHNAISGLDVTLDNNILASDALAVINHINAFGMGPIPNDPVSGTPYIDVTADNRILAGDALAIINHLNAFGPTIGLSEGEPALSSLPPTHVSLSHVSLSNELLALLATDILEATRHRRR